MNTRPESWEAVAKALGERLRYQANQCPEGELTFEGGDIATVADAEAVHRVPDEHADTCPYCADTLAFRRYEARLRGERYRPTDDRRAGVDAS